MQLYLDMSVKEHCFFSFSFIILHFASVHISVDACVPISVHAYSRSKSRELLLIDPVVF